MPFFSWPKRGDDFTSRLERARTEGFRTGFREGGLFRLAVGESYKREQALDWLNSVVDDGRAELEDQHAWEREVEAWDICCRIAFLLELT
jgi:hypothetical protein